MWLETLRWRVACLFTSPQSRGCSLTTGYVSAASGPFLNMTLDARVQERCSRYGFSGRFFLPVGVELHLRLLQLSNSGSSTGFVGFPYSLFCHAAFYQNHLLGIVLKGKSIYDVWCHVPSILSAVFGFSCFQCYPISLSLLVICLLFFFLHLFSHVSLWFYFQVLFCCLFCENLTWLVLSATDCFHTFFSPDHQSRLCMCT